ncbi:YggS family pyridoxal phosphate-dependent enzyme [Rhodococcus sp. UNC363MFTsu5.1]|uniref:YggS family pyridoxal phosphate-dependent enzyme n=1 Tax=Rhodococcus sp. UNC363MFTsu5.1 TaxID=1449069 RepID=UPI000480A3F3|nr:YggS family pyridoxal phosphate-dependent enzyme [Rhodococcus sp. UNC363MFTsu5.1]
MNEAPSPRAAEIAAALTEVGDRLGRACLAAGRNPDDVQLLPVTKFFPASDVAILYGLGCREFGESREQEAASKVAEFGALTADVRWHMIGSVQRNKARSIAQWAYAIHSVDSPRLVDALAKAATVALAEGGREQSLRVLLQVSLDGDPLRGGVPIDELPELADRAESAAGLELSGLMAVPPLGSDPERAFAELQAVHANLLRSHPAATQLSAGMTGDLEVAVRYGSTCVRVGTALLGSRPIASN